MVSLKSLGYYSFEIFFDYLFNMSHVNSSKIPVFLKQV